jgi:uncharacterized protein YcbK (DUF882 family)
MALRHFKLEEFACNHCGVNHIDPELVAMLDDAREDAGVPFKINSGYRCEFHNAAVGGSAASSHMKGLAADIACRSSLDRFWMIAGLMNAGFKRIGIRQDFIHVDIDPDKDTEVVWLYG